MPQRTVHIAPDAKVSKFSVDYGIIRTREGIFNVLQQVIDSGHLHAGDVETTGLDPKEGAEMVVWSIAGPAVNCVIHPAEAGVKWTELAPYFEQIHWIVFYSGFELRFIRHCIGVDQPLHDVGYLRRAIDGGGSFSLSNLAAWDLNIDLDKTLQADGWGVPKLTEEQYEYAYMDSYITYELWVKWLERANEGHRRAYNHLNLLVYPVVEMEDAGITLDKAYHKTVIALWEKRRATAEGYLRKMVTHDEIPNLGSDTQVANFLKTILEDDIIRDWPKTEKAQKMSLQRAIVSDMAKLMPYPVSRWLAAMLVYRRAANYLSTFGTSLLYAADREKDGRVRARFNIGAARTLRFSSSGPNLQNIPKSQLVRRSFVAGLGRVLVGADFSGVEVRVLAEISGDQVLLDDQVYGDIHREVAAFMLNKDPADVSKEERSRAKALTFLTIYGGTSAAVALKYKIDEDTAQEYIDRWGDRYSAAMDYRNKQYNEASVSGVLTSAAGNTIKVGRGVSLPKCANYGVQSSAFFVMAASLNRLMVALDEARDSKEISSLTRIVFTVHDEIGIETTTSSAEKVYLILQDAMRDGWLDIFPGTVTDNLLEGGIGVDWAAIH